MPVLHEIPTNERVEIQARDLLARLNDLHDQDSIAYHLERNGITGRPVESCTCALSNYILQQIPEVKCAWVSPTWVALYSDERHIKTEWRVPISLGMMPLVRSFIKRFDAGMYVFLLDSPS